MLLFKVIDRKGMLLWDTYTAFRYVEPKTTEYGSFKKCIMLTVGRSIKPSEEIDVEAIKSLPSDTQKVLLEKYSIETFLRPELSLRDKLINAMIKAYFSIDKKIRKRLGIKMTYDKETKQYEVYQYQKFRHAEDMLPLLTGLGVSISYLAKKEGKTPAEIEDIKRRMFNNLITGFEIGLKK